MRPKITKPFIKTILLAGVLFLASFSLAFGLFFQHKERTKQIATPAIDFSPKTYVVYRTNKLIVVDGKMDEEIWHKVAWTNSFVNIKGAVYPHPEYDTRVKLLWNDQYLYITAVLEEKHVWATMKKHDAPLYFENAFEIFIDPDGDTQHYLEFGINALSTIYDLLLTRPYRDEGYPLRAYNIEGLKTGVFMDGSINNPKDKDKKWTIEIAFPMETLQELNLLGGQSPPEAGDQWRVQFARAERQLLASGNVYTLKKDPEKNRPLPSKYTSWTPQGLVNLHYPEMWGFIQFSDEIAGKGTDTFRWEKGEWIKWALRNVYYRLKQYYLNHSSYTDNISRLDIDKIDVDEFNFSPVIHATKNTFIASSRGFNKEKIWFINQNGKIWCEKY